MAAHRNRLRAIVEQTDRIGGHKAIVTDAVDRTRCGRAEEEACLVGAAGTRALNKVIIDLQGRTVATGVAEGNTVVVGIGDLVVLDGLGEDRITDQRNTVGAGVRDLVVCDGYGRCRA